MTSLYHITALLIFCVATASFSQHNQNYGAARAGLANGGGQGGGMNGQGGTNGQNGSNGMNGGNGGGGGGQMGGGGGGGMGGGGMGGGGSSGPTYKESRNNFAGAGDKGVDSKEYIKAMTETKKGILDTAKTGMEMVNQTIKDAPKDVVVPKELVELSTTFYDKLGDANVAKIRAQGDFMVDGINKSAVILQNTVYAFKIPGSADPNKSAAVAGAATKPDDKGKLTLNGDKFSGVTATSSTATTAEKRAAAVSSLASSTTTSSPLDAPRGYKAPARVNQLLK